MVKGHDGLESLKTDQSDELDSLVKTVKVAEVGSPEYNKAITRIVELHLGLSERLARRCGVDDEYLDVARFALTIAAFKIKDKLRDNGSVTRFLASRIVWALAEARCRMHVVRCHRMKICSDNKKVEEAEKKGEGGKAAEVGVRIVSLDAMDNGFHMIGQKNKGNGRQINTALVVDTDGRIRELRDAIAVACKSHESQRIVRMREAGFVDAEIGERLNMCTATVGNIRRRIYTEFIRLWHLT